MREVNCLVKLNQKAFPIYELFMTKAPSEKAFGRTNLLLVAEFSFHPCEVFDQPFDSNNSYLKAPDATSVQIECHRCYSIFTLELKSALEKDDIS